MNRVPENSLPSDRVIWGLARLLADIDTDVFDNGVADVWRRVGECVRAVGVQDRREVLRLAIAGIAGIDWDVMCRHLAAIDPMADPAPAEEPVHASTDLPTAVPFPIEALPSALRDYVREGAEAIGCPRDYIAVFLLASVSAAIGTTVRLQIKSEWYEWGALYTAVVAPSGAKKTPALKYALRFANEKSIALDLEHKHALDTYEQDMAQFRAATEARKRAKDRSNLPPVPDKPRRPTLGRTTVSDTTVEALAKRLKENPRGLLLVRDEMAGLLLGMNQYRGGHGNDVPFYLSVWSGVQTTIDRKQDEDPVVLHQPLLSITGGIQPAVLPRILGKERLEDGFTPRILFSDPEPLPHCPSDAVVRDETVEQARHVYDRLWDIKHEQAFVTPRQPHLVRLTRDARAQFKEWEAAIGRRIEELSVDDPFRAPLAKMPGYLGRLALILHVVKWVDSGRDHFTDLDMQTLSEAIMLADYFVAHAGRVWHRLLESPEDTQMRQVLNWMARKRVPVTAREVLQSGVAGLKRSHEVNAVLARMVECGLIERQSLGRTERFALKNPGWSGE